MRTHIHNIEELEITKDTKHKSIDIDLKTKNGELMHFVLFLGEGLEKKPLRHFTGGKK